MDSWERIALKNAEDAKRRQEDPTYKPQRPEKRQRTGPLELSADFKEKVVASIPLRDLTWSEVKIGKCSILKDRAQTGLLQSKIVSLSNAAGLPLIIAANGGGLIPEGVGVKTKKNKDDEYTVSATIDNDVEHNALVKFCDDMFVWIAEEAPKHYPPATLITEANVVRFFCKPRPKIAGGADCWPSTIRAKAKKQDLVSSDSRLSPNLIITTDTEDHLSIIPHLSGMRWTEMKIELASILFGWKEDSETKLQVPAIYVVANMRRMTVKEDPEQCHYVFPHQQAEHDAHPCIRKHHRATPIADVRLSNPTEYIVFPLVKNKLTRNARIQRADGSKVLIELNGGGTIPYFAINKNQNNQYTWTFSVRNPDEVESCDQFTDDINTNIILPNRATYYPKTTDDVNPKFFLKPFLKDLTDEAKEKNSDRSITVIFDPKELGTSLMIVDENGKLVLDAETLSGRTWAKIVVAVYGLYVNSKGKLFEAGITKRLIYAELAPEVTTYNID